jgi:hypothetical protein
MITEATTWPGGSRSTSRQLRSPFHEPASRSISWQPPLPFGGNSGFRTPQVKISTLIRSPPCFHDHRNDRLAWRDPLHLPTTSLIIPCSSKPLQFLTTSVAVWRKLRILSPQVQVCILKTIPTLLPRPPKWPLGTTGAAPPLGRLGAAPQAGRASLIDEPLNARLAGFQDP